MPVSDGGKGVIGARDVKCPNNLRDGFFAFDI